MDLIEARFELEAMGYRATKLEKGSGMLYTKGSEEFWLNKETLDTLPKDEITEARLEALSRKLTEAGEKVKGDYRNFFFDRAAQVDSWLFYLKSKWAIDERHVLGGVREFEALV
jgi:hypothetical protein